MTRQELNQVIKHVLICVFVVGFIVVVTQTCDMVMINRWCKKCAANPDRGVDCRTVCEL